MRLPSRDGVSHAVACPLMVSALQLDRITHGGGSRVAWPPAGRGAWQALFALSDEASPFLSLSWTGEWLSTFGESLRPAQLVFDDATGRTIGTCLLTRRAKAFGPIALRRAYLNTDGEDPSESVIIEHNAVLTAPGHERQVADALADYLDATNVDEFYASGLGEHDVDRLRAAFPRWGFEVEWRESPYVDLTRLRLEGRSHLDVLSANTRAQMRRALRAYASRGAFTIEVASSPAEAETMLAELISLHNTHWRRKGQEGAFASLQRQRFHGGFTHAGVVAGECVLLRVRIADQTIGVVYFIVAKGLVHFYQAGFAYDSDPKIKPGLVTHHLAIEYFLQHNYREYDFLASAPNEGRYKRSLATDVRRLGWVMLSRAGIRRAVFDLARSARTAFRTGMPAARSVRESSTASTV